MKVWEFKQERKELSIIFLFFSCLFWGGQLVVFEFLLQTILKPELWELPLAWVFLHPEASLCCFLQVVPKPLTSAAQVVAAPQTQQRLIMPAIQPNLTNLPLGTVLAPAPGGGNMGYAVLPAQYVTQVSGASLQVRSSRAFWVKPSIFILIFQLQQSPFVTLASSSGFQASSGMQTQAKLPLNG